MSKFNNPSNRNNDASGSNVTTAYEYINCGFGCDTSLGLCLDPNPEFNYGYLMLSAFAIGIFSFLYLIKVFSKEQEYLKFLFMFLAMLLQIGLLFSVGIAGQTYSNTYIANSSSIAFKIGLAVAWIMLGMLLWSFGQFVMGLASSFAEKRGS